MDPKLTQRIADLRAIKTNNRPMGHQTMLAILKAEGWAISDPQLRIALGLKPQHPTKQEAPVPASRRASEAKDPADVLLDLLTKRKGQGISHQELNDFSDGVLARLESAGYALTIKGGRIVLEREPETKVIATPIAGIFDPSRKVHRFGVYSDSHLGGLQAQPGFLRSFFQEASRRGCSALLNCGDTNDGPPSMHKGFVYELGLHRADDQADYSAALIRESDLPHYVLGGNHDGAWFKEAGLDIVRMMADRADNITNLGPIQAWIEGPNGDQNFIRMFHPGDGSSYALSYKDQKTAEYLVLQNDKVPTGFHFTGHYHKQNQMRGPNGARYLLVPSSCGTTSFMKAKRLVNQAGAYFIEFTLDAQGRVDRCIIEDVILPPDQWVKCDYTARPRTSDLLVKPSRVWGA